MSTEDTTAQLREQIAGAAKQVQLRLGPNAIEMAQRGTPIPLNGTEADLVATAVLPIVLAQVEAAKATARREALEQAADELEARRGESPGLIPGWLRARASAQGVAAPAEVIATAVIPANTIKVGDRINFKWSGGQGAQSSGHEYWPPVKNAKRLGCVVATRYVDGTVVELCGLPAEHRIHQRVPGQPGEQDTADD